MNNQLPLVSVIVPMRNEERYIAACLQSILAGDYPHDRLEILCVDGRSQDTTRGIVQRYSVDNPCVKLIDNPKRTFSCGVNVGVSCAMGDFIAIMGAHATYEIDYLSKCVRYQAEFQADNVGGSLLNLPRNNNLFGKAVALVMSHPFGAGNATYRTGSREPRWVDTVFGGFYPKKLFECIGPFNEYFRGSSDIDFNNRLRKAGGQVLLAPDIVAYYHSDASFLRFVMHNYHDGIWSVYPLKFGSRIFTWRHLVPLCFVSSLMGTAIMTLLWPLFLWLLVSILASYFLVGVLSSVPMARRTRSFRLLFILPIVFATRHVAYGIGSLAAVVNVFGSKAFWRGLFGNLRERNA